MKKSILGPLIESRHGISPRSMLGLANNNWLYVAGSGSGKNVAANKDLVNEVVGRAAIIMNDPRGDNTPVFLAEVNRQWNKIAIDDLPQNSRVLPVRLIACGRTPEENRLYADQAMDYLEAFTDVSLDDAPMKRYYARRSIELYQNLPPDVRDGLPASIITYLFKPNSKINRWLLSHCQDEELYETFARLRHLHESPRIQTVGAAERLLDHAFGSPTLRARDTGRYLDWQKLLSEKWIVITRGGPGVSRDAIRAVIRARNAEVINHVENR